MNLPDAPCPWLFQEPFWSFMECCESLSLSPSLIFCLHMSLQTLSLTVDIVLLMISPYGTNLILNLKICLGLKSKGVPTK